MYLFFLFLLILIFKDFLLELFYFDLSVIYENRGFIVLFDSENSIEKLLL